MKKFITKEERQRLLTLLTDRASGLLKPYSKNYAIRNTLHKANPRQCLSFESRVKIHINPELEVEVEEIEKKPLTKIDVAKFKAELLLFKTQFESGRTRKVVKRKGSLNTDSTDSDISMRGPLEAYDQATMDEVSELYLFNGEGVVKGRFVGEGEADRGLLKLERENEMKVKRTINKPEVEMFPSAELEEEVRVDLWSFQPEQNK